MSAPIWWDVPEEAEERRRQGGTVCFVHTGKRVIGVTAGHIHVDVSARLKDGRSRWCQVGAHSFDPERQLIDYDVRLDLATYALSEFQVVAADADLHHALEWPPTTADDAMHIVGGWPWALSEMKDGGSRREHSFLHFICRNTEVGPTNLGFATYTSKSIPWGRNALPPGTNLGGMSGGPVYRLSERGLTTLTLVGVIYEYQPSFELALARPLTLISSDGQIIR